MSHLVCVFQYENNDHPIFVNRIGYIIQWIHFHLCEIQIHDKECVKYYRIILEAMNQELVIISKFFFNKKQDFIGESISWTTFLHLLRISFKFGRDQYIFKGNTINTTGSKNNLGAGLYNPLISF